MSSASSGRRWSWAGVPGALGDILLWLLAGLGLICIVLVIIAKTQSLSLIMFSTGSMSPTIPAGSVALVQEVPAAEVSVGDVVTVERPGKLPITHRIVDIESGMGAMVELTLRGDANEQNDPAPYQVSEVRIVRGSVPELAHVVVFFQRPAVLGVLSVLAAGLVTWAFWPRPQGRRARR
ncbi:signal peptidase I [Glutamicibacter endophyticus]|uniref:signal peptidase I n=1 Tax=Glutamicibacter endophyticus TaxID=1522174 RepID=UPI003AF1C86F